MRQYFKLMAFVALALLVATPAMALDFKFGAEYRVRFYNMINQNLADGPGTNPGGVQLRIRPRFDVSDDNGNMTATLRLEIGDVEWGNGGGAAGTQNGGTYGTVPTAGARVGNGAGGSMGTDGVNVETKWGYVDFASPFGVPLRWRAGLQPWYLAKGILIDDDVAGLRAYGKYSMVSYDFGWYRASGGQVTTAIPAGAAGQNATSNTQDNNLDFYQAKMDLAIAKWMNPGLYYIYGRNAASATPSAAAATVASQNFLGLTVTGDLGFLKYDFDAVAGQQNGGANGNFAAAGRTEYARLDDGCRRAHPGRPGPDPRGGLVCHRRQAERWEERGDALDLPVVERRGRSVRVDRGSRYLRRDRDWPGLPGRLVDGGLRRRVSPGQGPLAARDVRLRRLHGEQRQLRVQQLRDGCRERLLRSVVPR